MGSQKIDLITDSIFHSKIHFYFVTKPLHLVTTGYMSETYCVFKSYYLQKDLLCSKFHTVSELIMILVKYLQ